MSELVERARSKISELPLSEVERLGLLRERAKYFLNISYPSLQAMEVIPRGVGPLSEASLPQAIPPCAIYIHIPFCTAECYYCHYYKVFHKDPAIVDAFLDSFEIELKLKIAQRGPLTALSLYVGGGTPSYLLPRQIERLFAIIHEHIRLLDGCEVSFEMHPESSDSQRLRVLADSGVNRINLGVESLSHSVLLNENRRHTVGEALNAIGRIQEQGFLSYNLDLIYGLRDQTVAVWSSVLDRLAELSPPSTTLYYLRVKRKTAEAAALRRAPNRYPSESDLLLMHVMNFERMEVDLGYRQSPVDWYIREDEYFHNYQEHNWSKSDEVPLVGFGPSAYSYINGWQFYNINDLETYTEVLSHGEIPVWKGELLKGDEPMRRCLMLGLKTGIDRAWFLSTFGVDPVSQFSDEMAALSELGLLDLTPASVDLTYLGKLFADEVGQYFYSSEMRGRMDRIDSDLVSTTHPRFN